MCANKEVDIYVMFWLNQIVEESARWRVGYSTDRPRQVIRNFKCLSSLLPMSALSRLPLRFLPNHLLGRFSQLNGKQSFIRVSQHPYYVITSNRIINVIVGIAYTSRRYHRVTDDFTLMTYATN